jgi:hypothetical protein
MTGTLCCRTFLGTVGAAALESIAIDRARNYNDHTTVEKKALRCDCGSRFCAAMLAATNVHATVTSNTWTLLSSKAAATWQQKTVPRFLGHIYCKASVHKRRIQQFVKCMTSNMVAQTCFLRRGGRSAQG